MKILATVALLMFCSIYSTAQDTAAKNCPTIFVTGPEGIVEVGELARYRATVSNAEQYSLEYVWSVSAGRIKDGQGKSSIRVIVPASALTVTVNVKGLPEGCPSLASQWQSYHPPPLPIQIYALEPSKIFDQAAATRVATIMLENATNQLYILAGDVGRQNSPSFQQKQRTIVELLSRHGITPDRITMAPVYSDVELFQFWRVPPGAENPTCLECEKLEQESKECPAISVDTPFKTPERGKPVTFIATLSGKTPQKIGYSWLVSFGKILGGQGTRQIRVQTPNPGNDAVTATVRVTGLNAGCPDTASATAPIQ